MRRNSRSSKPPPRRRNRPVDKTPPSPMPQQSDTGTPKMTMPRMLSLTPPLTSASPERPSGGRSGHGAPLVAIVRAGIPQADIPADLTNPLVIATIVTDTKAYVLPEVIAAIARLRWDGDKVLHVTYNGRSHQSRKLVQRLWEGPSTSVAVDLSVSRDNQWHSGIVALLREETRQALLQTMPEGCRHVLWVDCDVVVPEHAAEALAAHGQGLVSGVVPSRRPGAVIARDAFGQGLLRPADIRSEGLRKLAMSGFGCLLMQREVLEVVHWRQDEVQSIVDGGGGEDDHSCAEAAQAGHRLYLDPQVLCSHYAEDRSGFTAALDNKGRTLQTFPVGAQPYSALKVALRGPEKPRRVLWMMASVGCYGGVKVCREMMLAMHGAGWEVSICAVHPWEHGGWTNWDFAKRLSLNALEQPYDMVVSNYHATMPLAAKLRAQQRVALIQSDEPEWKTQGAGSQVEFNFRLPGFQHVIIANHMRGFAEKYGHNIVGQLDNGVDNLTFYPSQFLRREWPHSLMMIRKNAPVWYTGQEYAEAAIAELAQRYNDLEVVLVGQKPERWPCRVRHVTTFDPGELRGLFNSASCFVRPSLIEGFSLTDLEAMACGTPLVVTPRGLPDVARHGEGVLFAPADLSETEFIRRAFNERLRPELGQEIIAGIVEGVTRVFEEPELRERLSRNGLRLARARTWEGQRAQWMEIVDRVMGGE